MNRKAIVLLSGGLDSILAIRIMQEQNIEMEAVNFLTSFCTCTRKGCRHAATEAAETLGVPLKVFNISEEFLEIVKHPKHGYGSNMNPCIDCRIFIFSRAKEEMAKAGASFIITGEVLGERPMSQRRNAILFIEKAAGLKDLVLRPLSAKLFDPTIPEREGVVDREKLLAISGRSRKPQIEMARQFGIKDYPCPAGGCLLTDPGFAKRVKDLLEHNSLTLDEVRLLKLGRHFRLSAKAKLIIGRDETDNASLESQKREGDMVLRLKDRPSPFSILRGSEFDEDLIRLAAAIVAHHTKFRDEEVLKIGCWDGSSAERATVSVRAAGLEEIERLRI